MTETRMTKGEREDLLRLIKQRERVCKTAATLRSATLLADFEAKISAVHSFDKEDVWRDAHAAAAAAFKEANAKILEHAKSIGIPEEFAPSLYFQWQRRGETEFANRRAELRRVAKAEIEALEQTARVQIESESVKAQTEIIANGLTSTAAIVFLGTLPSVETLMPALELGTIEQKLIQKKPREREWVQ